MNSSDPFPKTKEQKRSDTRWRRLVQKALKGMGGENNLVQYPIFGVEGTVRRWQLRTLNTRLKQAWRQKQKSDGKWMK